VENLTLIIPAKYEEASLPLVLKEIKNLNCKIYIILEKTDLKTIESIKNFNCEIIFQSSSGYGGALIEGINKVDTKYLCIFNGDGSFEPKDLEKMMSICQKYNFVFASRYLEGAGSDDDTLITRIGNFIFTSICNIFFLTNLSDILFTFILGETKSFKALNLKCLDFCLCVEIPINAKKINASYIDFPSYERKRIAGKKKVNEFKDGFKILIYMIKRFKDR
jgi:hypothetical protein